MYGPGNALEHYKALEKIKQMTPTETGNLPRNVMFCVGKSYTITVNTGVAYGLANGAVGNLAMSNRPKPVFPKSCGSDSIRMPRRNWCD